MQLACQAIAAFSTVSRHDDTLASRIGEQVSVFDSEIGRFAKRASCFHFGIEGWRTTKIVKSYRARNLALIVDCGGEAIYSHPRSFLYKHHTFSKDKILWQ